MHSYEIPMHTSIASIGLHVRRFLMCIRINFECARIRVRTNFVCIDAHFIMHVRIVSGPNRRIFPEKSPRKLLTPHHTHTHSTMHFGGYILRTVLSYVWLHHSNLLSTSTLVCSSTRRDLPKEHAVIRIQVTILVLIHKACALSGCMR